MDEKARRARRKREVALTFSPGERLWGALFFAIYLSVIAYGLLL